MTQRPASFIWSCQFSASWIFLSCWLCTKELKINVDFLMKFAMPAVKFWALVFFSCMVIHQSDDIKAWPSRSIFLFHEAAALVYGQLTNALEPIFGWIHRCSHHNLSYAGDVLKKYIFDGSLWIWIDLSGSFTDWKSKCHSLPCLHQVIAHHQYDCYWDEGRKLSLK